MDFKPLRQATATRPLSKSTIGWKEARFHPLNGTQGHSRLRAHFSIGNWLLMGALLQSLIMAYAPIPAFYALLAPVCVAVYKITRLIFKIYGVVHNPQMDGVQLGRTSAVFPPKDGSMIRQPGETVGGEGMAIILLSSKCNHPLGMFYPPYKKLGQLAKAMYKDLQFNAEEHGFLGYSDYNSNDSITQPVGMSVMYFKSIEHLHTWAHKSVHRDGWDWWNAIAPSGKVDCITISHEVYRIPAGGWENIYINAAQYDFAATTHAVKAAGGERKWLCPVMDASKGFKSSAARMGTVKA